MTDTDFYLSIESSCDETAVCVLSCQKKTSIRDKDTAQPPIEVPCQVLAQRVASQIKTHAKHGGVVPELASRQHARVIHTLVDDCLDEAGITLTDLDTIVVTKGPGLEGALLVGMTYAKTLAHCLDLPLVGVNHLHGHIYAAFLNDDRPKFPFLSLIVSGGHTQLVTVSDHFKFTLLGQTRDDAAGEAFDKVARVLGLGYPGGPVIDRLAKTGDPTAFNFPRAMIKQGLEFSFSGLKTAVIQQVRHLEADLDSETLSDETKANIAASFQAAVIDILVHKSVLACKKSSIKELVVCGGVSANSGLKAALEEACARENIRLFVPPLHLCTDNAAIIGVAGIYMDHCDINLGYMDVMAGLTI